MRLPEPLAGHCMTRVNQSHILITGGYKGGDRILISSYLYSEETGFTKIEDMKTPRAYHGCSAINDNVVFVAGGKARETEYLDPTTQTWRVGPELPTSAGVAMMTGSLLVGSNTIFKLEELGLGKIREVGSDDVSRRHGGQIVSREDSRTLAIMSLARKSWAFTVPKGRLSSSEISS